MERQVPKNVRQIGNVSDSPKIYVEDYVDTFLTQLCEKCEKAKKGPVGAFLVGDIQTGDDGEYVYIYGAIQMHDLKLSGNEYLIDEDTWRHAYEDCKQYFEDGEMLGWFVAHQGVALTPEPSTVKLHKRSFPKKNTVFIMKDPVEKEESYYVHKMNDLMAIGGHYTYYEKNPCMQNYMISSRKKNGVFPSETVEDRAAQDFRDLARKRSGYRRSKKGGGLMYAASACLVLILVVMGVSMLNSFDRMRSVQDTLETIAGTTDTVETRETGGQVTAVTSEEQAAAEEGTPDGQASGEEALTDDSGDGASGDSAGETVGADASAGSETGSSEGGQALYSEGGDDAEAGAEGQAAGAGGENGSDGVYVVEQGDTLAIISRKVYGDVSHVDAICRMNGLDDGNLIYIGQKLLLP